MASICILTGSHLCRNPRVVKEASTLSEAGYEVTVLGPTLSDELAAQDAEILRGAAWTRQTVIDLRPCFSTWRRLGLRASRRFGAEAIRWLSWESPQALGYGITQTLHAAKRKNDDLYIAHQELGSWVGCELAKEGRRVGADLEDWYSRDLLPEAQARRPLRLLRQCEDLLLKQGVYVTTTSNAMASALAETYDAPKPTVIYNSFPWIDRAKLDPLPQDRADHSLPSLHWFSQTIGPGRGLETLCAALYKVDAPVVVHMRGSYTPATEAWLRNLLPKDRGHQLYLHELVHPEELLSRIAEHDIGLALDLTVPQSRDLTVTNKILHYLLGGLAVVASDTSGQAEIAAAAPHAVRLFRCGDATALAEQLNLLLTDPALLADAKAAALAVAKSHFCWERQAPILLNSVEMALRAN